MEFNQIETSIEEIKNDEIKCINKRIDLMSISLETEVPEALYVGMKDFISSNNKSINVENIQNILASRRGGGHACSKETPHIKNWLGCKARQKKKTGPCALPGPRAACGLWYNRL